MGTPRARIRRCNVSHYGWATPTWAVDIPGQPRVISCGWHFYRWEDAIEAACDWLREAEVS